MSHSGIPLVDPLVSGTLKLAKGALNIPDLPGAQDLPSRGGPGGPADPEIQKRATEQFATREQSIQKAAAAAGAQRSDNEADLLGYSAPKRKTASRVLLGGR